MIDRRRFLELTGAAAVTALGCADDPPGATPDGAVLDVTDVTPPDAPTEDAALDDVTVDATPDVPSDKATPDAALDASSDADPVGATDAVGDASTDVSNDAATDGPGTDALTAREDLAAFPLGVMAGEMSADVAILWTRFAASGPLFVMVWSTEEGRVVDEVVTPADGGFVHARVRGLRAGVRYVYAFVRREGPTPSSRVVSRSPLGRFRAALAPDSMEVITFGGTSCTHQRSRPFPVLQHAAGRTDLDFFVHSGDLAYCDDSRSLADFRAKYAENLSSAGMRSLFASTGLYATLDDHEVDNNFNPETVSAATLANARSAYFENHPQRRDPAAPDRVWRSARWGRTLELFILDCRTERRPSTRSRPDAQYISRAQMDWLKAGLAASPAVFKLVVNSVPITNFPLVFDLNNSDRWEGYAAQRNEILDHINNRDIQGVWWLSGDFHLGSVALVQTSGPSSRMREVLMGPGGQIANPLFATLIGRQWEFATGEDNYTVFRCDPAARAVTVTFVNGAGREIFSRRYA